MYCSACGKMMAEDAVVCLGCGRLLVQNARLNSFSPNHATSGPEENTLSYFSPGLAVFLHFITIGLFTTFYYLSKHGRIPKRKQDDPSAGKAIGFLFIPIFNIYWFFFVWIRLSQRINDERLRHNLSKTGIHGMAVTVCVLCVIPIVNVINFVIVIPIFVGMLQASINELTAR